MSRYGTWILLTLARLDLCAGLPRISISVQRS
jgi:hypothetical protein